MEGAQLAGRLLAERHLREGPVEPAVAGSLVNVAESPRAGDWSLRSALVRLAQPEPVRASAALELVRRLDAVVHVVARALERRTVLCDRELTLDSLLPRTGDRSPTPAAPYPDTRSADLARLIRSAGSDGDAALDGYLGQVDLDVEEHRALPLLQVALELDALAEALVRWAPTAPAPPPVDLVDETCGRVEARLDALGVPREDRPPVGGRG